MLPELRDGSVPEPNALVKEYSSGDDVLDLAGTAALLQKHRLMVEDVDAADQAELLR
jgi:UDP-glucose 4-epimerase